LEDPDLALVRLARDGDDQAFHALIDRHARSLFRAALSLSHNRADAEDLMQETMLGAYRGLKNFAGRSSVRSWLLQILTRQGAKAWYRSRHNRATRPLEDSDPHREPGRPPTAADRPAASVDQRLDVIDVLKCLSPAHREVLVLRDVQGLSYQEIAEVIGVPRGTVESRLSRARAEFRRWYEGAP
jgi:RNA polymerase sigma-70 factor (ECF subfamily)